MGRARKDTDGVGTDTRRRRDGRYETRVTLNTPTGQRQMSLYEVKYRRYWFNEDTGEVWCLAEAPDKEAAERVHREAHGLVADEITEVKKGS